MSKEKIAFIHVSSKELIQYGRFFTFGLVGVNLWHLDELLCIFGYGLNFMNGLMPIW